MTFTHDDITVFLQMFGVSVGLFGLCCPSPHDVSTYTDAYRAERIKRTRHGEIVAGTVVVLLGAAISSHSRNNHALYASVIIVAAIVAGYERMIQDPIAVDGRTV